MKAKEVQRTRQTAIVMDLSDMEYEAGQILTRARQQVEKILTDAKAAANKDAIAAREEARRVGREEGLRIGTEAGQKQGHEEAVGKAGQLLAELTTRWSKTLDILHQNMPAHVADAKTDVVRLALAVAEKVTRQTALRNQHVAEATIADTLQLIGSARKVSMHVNPEEQALLQKYLPEILAKIRTIDSVELIADETVSPGGCLARFGAGQVDARLETQIERISKELLAGE